MRIAISAESTIDVQEELLKEYDIKTVAFTVMLGSDAKQDGTFSNDEIFNYVLENKTLPKTSAVNEFQYEEHFNNIFKEGYDAIIHITLSSEISSAYINACMVARKMENVYIIDSRTLSTGIALLAIYASKLIKLDLDVTKIVRLIKTRIPNVCASFVLSRLDYLFKGGRCNAIKYIGSSLLKIRPQIIVKDGKMQVGKKFRGKYNDCVTKYVLSTLEEFKEPDLSEVFITYTTLSNEMIEEIKNILINRGFKNIHITKANSTIASHCGENCMGVLYINDNYN